jgi:small GTP-binding protein
MVGGDFRATLLTARGAGGIAVVELRGADRFAVVVRLLGRASLAGADLPGVAAPPRLCWLWADGERLDQALVVVRQASIELHLHGSLAVLAALERVLGPLQTPSLPAREHILLTATSLAQLDFALEQQQLLAPYRSFAAWLDAHARDPAALRAAYARWPAAAALTTPCALALCGRKNAGKSTLMNRLLLAERVLAGPSPGLTRDPVREPVALDGYPYELIDTAGEGDVVDDLDARAIARSRRAREAALAVLVVDASAGVGDVERALFSHAPPPLLLRTKCDLPHAPWPHDLPAPGVDVSCQATADAAAVRARVGAWLRHARGLPPAGPLGGVAPADAHEAAALAALLTRVAP